MEYEIPINSNFDNEVIDEKDVTSGVIFLMEHLVLVAKDEIKSS